MIETCRTIVNAVGITNCANHFRGQTESLSNLFFSVNSCIPGMDPTGTHILRSCVKCKLLHHVVVDSGISDEETESNACFSVGNLLVNYGVFT